MGLANSITKWVQGKQHRPGLAVTALAAASLRPGRPSSPLPFPCNVLFAEEFSDRAFAAVHQRAGDLPANHRVFPPLPLSPRHGADAQ